jgi:hypothetical protein
MRHLGRAWLTGMAVVALAGGCEQTLHLYKATPDGGSTGGSAGSVAAAGGTGGSAGAAGRGGKFGFGGNGAFDGGAPDGHCFSPAIVTFTPDAPQMVIALDRSTAMNQPFVPDSQTQLNGAVTDIGARIYEYTNPRSDRQPIGFSFISFPDYMTGCQQSGCCASDTMRDWVTFWKGVTNCAMPSTGCVASANRPISAALQGATATLTGANAARLFQRYVLLVTDGSPKNDCSPNDCVTAQDQVSMMTAQSIKLRVVGIGDQSAIGACPKSLVTAAADLGRYYAAPSDTDLQTVLDQVMEDAVCVGTLSPAPGPSNNLQVSFTYTGPVPAGGQDGWTYDNNGHLRLHGHSCSTYVAAGSQNLFVTNGCDSPHGGSGAPPF